MLSKTIQQIAHAFWEQLPLTKYIDCRGSGVQRLARFEISLPDGKRLLRGSGKLTPYVLKQDHDLPQDFQGGVCTHFWYKLLWGRISAETKEFLEFLEFQKSPNPRVRSA